MSDTSVTNVSQSRLSADSGKTANALKPKKGLNLETWMKDLPDACRMKHLSKLVIPGSRHSMTFGIRRTSAIAGDYTKLPLNGIMRLLRPFFLKKCLIRWSRVQNERLTSQLCMGIRYFDMRLQFDENTEIIRTVHLMKSELLSIGLSAINVFLHTHPKEIVILDFQHFLGFSEHAHSNLNNLIRATFGDKVCPSEIDMAGMSLDSMFSRGLQVIVIYRNFGSQNDYFKSRFFPIVYSKTANPSALKDSAIQRLSLPWPSKWFLIIHMILKPEGRLGLKRLLNGAQSLAKTALTRSTREFVDHLKNSAARPTVIVAEFIDLNEAEFSKLIVPLNYSEPTIRDRAMSRVPGFGRHLARYTRRIEPEVKKSRRDSSVEFMKSNSSWWRFGR